MQAECEALRADNERLRAENSGLADRVAALEAAAKSDSSTTSKPPLRDGFEARNKRAERRRDARAAKRAAGKHLARRAPDVTVDHHPSATVAGRIWLAPRWSDRDPPGDRLATGQRNGDRPCLVSLPLQLWGRDPRYPQQREQIMQSDPSDSDQQPSAKDSASSLPPPNEVSHCQDHADSSAIDRYSAFPSKTTVASNCKYNSCS